MTPPCDPTLATRTQDPIPQHLSPEEKQEIQDHAEELNPAWEQEGQTESIEFGAES